MSCVYFVEKPDTDIHHCKLLGECKLSRGKGKYPSCNSCKLKLLPDDPEFATKWVDPLAVTTRKKEPTKVLHNLLAGRSAFLIGGGPSANELPLELLNKRGVFSLAINNVAGHDLFHPQAFVCSDPPMKFSSSIWRDPGIMKFVPTPKLNKRRSLIREKVGNKFLKTNDRTYTSPNVWGFRRRAWILPDESFFTTDDAAWGNQDSGVTRTGGLKTVCTMLLGLRLLYYLGARTIFLVGVDFAMSPLYGYSFSQNRSEGASESNNRQFEIVNDWLCTMSTDGVFNRFGVNVYNCYQKSGLRAFPFVPFDKSIKEVVKGVEDTPDLSGWYEKTDEEEE